MRTHRSGTARRFARRFGESFTVRRPSGLQSDGAPLRTAELAVPALIGATVLTLRGPSATPIIGDAPAGLAVTIGAHSTITATPATAELAGTVDLELVAALPASVAVGIAVTLGGRAEITFRGAVRNALDREVASGIAKVGTRVYLVPSTTRPPMIGDVTTDGKRVHQVLPQGTGGVDGYLVHVGEQS